MSDTPILQAEVRALRRRCAIVEFPFDSDILLRECKEAIKRNYPDADFFEMHYGFDRDVLRIRFSSSHFSSVVDGKQIPTIDLVIP